MNVTTVMYHYVRDLENSNFPRIKALRYNEFINQIEYFKKNYTFISIEDYIDQLDNSSNELPKNSILLTFDDGYIDHYENVFPILNDNNIQGVFFPPAEVICEEKVLDVHKLHSILASKKNFDILLKEISKLLKERKFNEDTTNYDINVVDNQLKKLSKFWLIFTIQLLKREQYILRHHVGPLS